MKRTPSSVILGILGFLFAITCNAQVDERKKLAFETVERNAEQLAAVGDSIYYSAQLGMQEFESAKFLKETLEGSGFKGETRGAGMPTNIWAQWATGKPTTVDG